MTFALTRPRDGTARSKDSAVGGHEALVLAADAGLALLRRPGVRTGPVSYDRESGCVQLLVPEGSAAELPGLLAWLEWGDIELGLVCRAPAPSSPREAAVWLRPPERGCPADRVDLVRLVSAAATECHRARLRRTAAARMSPAAQPFDFS